MKDFAKIVKTPMLQSKPLAAALLLDKDSRYHEHYMQQTIPSQFSILINNCNLREIYLHETSKRTALIEQKLVVRETTLLKLKPTLHMQMLIYHYSSTCFPLF